MGLIILLIILITAIVISIKEIMDRRKNSNKDN